MDKEREIELARGLLAGSPEAFDAFVTHFQAKIFHYSWLMCGHREDAEEVAQETLLRIFENFAQLRDPALVRPWVFRIARNACLMKRRKSIFAPAHEVSLDANREVPLELPAAPVELPDRQFLRRELKSALDRAIAGLPDTYRAVVLLRDVEELSTEETAQILGLGTDVVKTRLHRGRVLLRQQLDQYLHADAAPRA